MKSTILLLTTGLFLLINPEQLKSQNYQTVNSGYTRFYLNSNQLVPDNILPVRSDLAVSPIPGDSVIYFYRIIRDTSTQFTGGCVIDTASSCWMGSHSLLKSKGDNLFFNKDGDTIHFKTKANLGDSWIFMRKTGFYFLASLDTIVYSVVSGINDSIKVISLQAYDNSGNAIQNLFNQKTFRLSKNYGFASLYNFYEFPADTNLYASIFFDPLTVGNVYDFEPGDIFHFEWGGPGAPPNYKIITILSKWTSSDNDTIYYLQKRTLYNNELIWDPNPHIVTNIVLDTATVLYVHPQSLLSSLLPHQKDHQYYWLLSYYVISNNPDEWNGRTTMQFDQGTDYTFDQQLNCFIPAFEPANSYSSYTKGCGASDYHFSDPAGNSAWHSSLFYYKKGSEIWGTPYIPTSVSATSSNKSLFEATPNPFRNTISIRLETTKPGDLNLCIYNITGKLILKIDNNFKQPGKYSYNPDLSALPNGIYFLTCISADGVQYKKIIRN